jgi:uncharacterized membrane protein YeiH
MQSSLLVFTDSVGIVSFTLSGLLAAKEKKIDPVGVFVVTFVTAFGGGIVRDLIIGNRPMYWIANQEYIWATLALSVFAPSVLRHFEDKLHQRLLVWLDAVGLGFFTAGGTSLSLTYDLPYLPAVLMGVCTGVFGGLLRDVFLNRLPMVMSDQLPYASAAFVGGWLYIGLHAAGTSEFAALMTATLFIVLVRMLCWYKGWRIVRYDGQPEKETEKKNSHEPRC